MKIFIASLIKTVISLCLCLFLSTPFAGFAQKNISPVYLHHDDDHYIRAHSNSKYFLEYINHNGKVYMYYNRTYNNKSKDLYFCELQIDNTGIADTTELAYGDKDFSDGLYFDKDDNMNSAFFGVDNYLFVVVQHKKDKKNQMYRLNLTTNDLDVVDLDNNDIYDRYSAAVCSGYDVILFRHDGGVQSFTFSTPDTNLIYHDANNAASVNDFEFTSAVAVNHPDEDKVYAYASYKNTDTEYFWITRFDLEDISQYSVIFKDTQYQCKEMELISGRSMSDGQEGPENTDGSVYLSVFSTDYDKYKDKDNKKKEYYKRIPINYGEIEITGDNFVVDFVKARICLSSDNYYAKSSKDALIDVVENYVPVDASTYMQGNDGFQKQNILISCDKKNETNFSVFPSDYYLIYEEDAPVQSDMANYADEQWKQTWSLIGIFDGAPPCAVDWEEWELLHEYAGIEIEPTELVWGMESEESSETTIKTECNWSVGAKVEWHPLKLNIDAKAKYAHANEKINKFSKTSTTKLTIPMPLTEENQELAVWYWMAPTIQRLAYSTFDWSDTELQHPINGVIDYAFITTGYTLIPETVPISAAPHYVSEPNEEFMTDWTERAYISNDTTIGFHAFQYGLSSDNYVFYKSTQGGTSSELITENEQITETSNTKTVDVEAEVGIGKPEVFEIGVTGSYNYNWTTSNKITTTFKKSIELNLTNMQPFAASAIYPESYYVHPYLFTPDDNEDWWYFDNPDLMGFKPWYLAYTVSLNNDKSNELLQLQSPAVDEVFYVDEPIFFSWLADLQQTKLVISQQPTNALKSIVYHGDLKSNSAEKVSGLATGIYFWRVAGISKDGEPVWSEFRKLMIVEKDFLSDNTKSQNTKLFNILPAKVYPNPANKGTVSVSYEIKDESSPVRFILYDISGQKLWEKTYDCQGIGIYNTEIQAENIKSHFGILKIANGNYIATKKVIVY